MRIDQEFANSFKYLTESLREWSERRVLYTPLVEKFEGINAEPQWSSNYLYVPVTGDKAKLAQAIRILRTAGLVSENKPKPNQPSFQSFYEDAGKTRKVYLNFTSSVCKRVQVGTKMEEVPVYQVKCS